MGLFALFLGLVGTLCTIMGILTATTIIPLLASAFTAIFWLTLAGVMFLASIACLLSRESMF